MHDCQCAAGFFFQFPDGAKVASVPAQIQTDFARMATLFQGTLKTAASSLIPVKPTALGFIKHIDQVDFYLKFLFIMIPIRYPSSIMGKKNSLPFSMAYW
jgi:hypothetical protein